MSYEDQSGLPHAFDRSAAFPDHSRVIFREGQRYFAQGAELNELQSIIAGRGRRVSDMVAKDGDRHSGANIIVDKTAKTVTLEAGEVYVRGDVRAVAAATFTLGTLAGEIVVGVRLTATTITEVERPALMGLEPGTRGEGEPGAARLVETIAWGHSIDGAPGDLYGVYLMRDGDVIDQTPPPNLSGVQQLVATYDDDVNGAYIVRGCQVTALGISGGAQQFAIAAGVANIRGFKRTREADLRHSEPETWDVELVSAESHTITGSPCTVALNHTPLANVLQLVVEKEVVAESVTKGTTNSQDGLAHTSVRQIIEVKQGATTYVANSDYKLTADKVDWTPGGAEPAAGSSYTVKYRYNDTVVPSGTTSGSVTFSGGVAGGEVQVTYNYKLPRIDLIGLDASGASVYVKGISAASNAMAPMAPTTVLKLAEVRNTWTGTPTVINNGTVRVTQDEHVRAINRLIDLLNLVGIERLQRDADHREVVAKKGVFADSFTSDDLRDAGVPQTASVSDGLLSLSIDATIVDIGNTAPILLDYSSHVALAQELATRCFKINPYQVTEPLPVGLSIEPRTDFYTLYTTTWLSPITRVFRTPGQANGTTTEVVSRSTSPLPFLRQRSIDFTITGFGAGEILTDLTFDGLDVKPPGIVAASGSGVISGSFAIPAGVAAGVKSVKATGATGRVARAMFRGQGTLEIAVLRKVTTLTILPPNPDRGSAAKDPQAQTFAIDRDCFIASVALKFCAKGDVTKPVYVSVVSTDNNYPAEEMWGIGRIDMGPVVLNAWTTVTFECPAFLEKDRKYAITVMTDDPDHSISGAKLGDFDTTAQRFVSRNPYTIGDRFSASAGLAWLVHPDSDLTFRLNKAVFSPLTKTVTLGTFAVTAASDLMVMAAAVIPTADAAIYFELELVSTAKTQRVQAGQNWELPAFYTGNVVVRAVLSGTADVSPVLLPGAQLLVGTIHTSDTYVTRAFSFAGAGTLFQWLKCSLPAGSTISVQYDKADGNWLALPLTGTETLNDGWVDNQYKVTGLSGVTTGRLKFTITGGPASRPYFSDCRAATY